MARETSILFDMLIYPFIFLLGTCLGSFLNVVIDRGPKNESVIKGRSRCDYCHKILGPLDLIPILSFFLLGGKCRYCHKKFSWQYPLVELITGLLFVTTYYFSPSNYLETIYHLILVCFMIVIFMIDLKLEIVLERVINSAIVLTLFYRSIILIFFSYTFFDVLLNIATGIAIALFFLFLIEVSRHRGMGEGDVKIGFWIGLVLGLNAILALFMAFVGGATIGLLLIFLGKKKFGQTVPLAPFLMTGMYLALLWGDKIINWYLATFLR